MIRRLCAAATGREIIHDAQPGDLWSLAVKLTFMTPLAPKSDMGGCPGGS